MPRVVAPLTDIQVKNAKPKDKRYKLADGGGLYLEVKPLPASSKLWKMKFVQASGKENTLSFGKYPEVSLGQARKQRDTARELKAAGIDPGRNKRDRKYAADAAAVNTFELLARAWREKTKATRAESMQKKNTAWLEKNIFPEIGSLTISLIKRRYAMNLAFAALEANSGLYSGLLRVLLERIGATRHRCCWRWVSPCRHRS